MQDNELCCKESINSIFDENGSSDTMLGDNKIAEEAAKEYISSAVKRKSEYWDKREMDGDIFYGGEFSRGDKIAPPDRYFDNKEPTAGEPIEVACKVKDFDEASLVAVSGPLNNNPTREDMACQSTSGLQLDEKGAYRIVPLGLISVQSEVHHLRKEIKGKRQQLADAKLNIALGEELIQLQYENHQIDNEMQKLSEKLAELEKLRNQLKS